MQEEGSGSPVSFPKRVGMIERRVHRCERERRSAVIECYPIDGGDDLFDLGQVFPNRRDRSKRCRTFPDVDGSDVAGPLVQILENVLVKQEKFGCVSRVLYEVAAEMRLTQAKRGRRELE